MGKSGDPPFPDHSWKSDLVNDFLMFFSDKVATIGSSLDIVGKDLLPPTSSDPVFLKSRSVKKCLASFSPISPDEVKALIRLSPCSSCFLDPIPNRLLKRVASVNLILSPRIRFCSEGYGCLVLALVGVFRIPGSFPLECC